jgi:hypothetical protein
MRKEEGRLPAFYKFTDFTARVFRHIAIMLCSGRWRTGWPKNTAVPSNH